MVSISTRGRREALVLWHWQHCGSIW
jgi:hypothetical protein